MEKKWMTKQKMMQIVYNQLAIDYNCLPEDFGKNGVLFTAAKKQAGRREMPFLTPRFEIITMGRSTIVNASQEILPYLKRKFAGKTRHEILTSQLVFGVNPYYLPDIENLKEPNVPGYTFALTDQNIQDFYELKGLHNALQYDCASKRPEVLAAAAYDNGILAGLACASADSQTMWQIGVDVLPAYRGKGIACKLVHMLSVETLSRGVVPYYTTDCGNLTSQRVAFKCGYFPAWAHCFKTRLPRWLLGISSLYAN